MNPFNEKRKILESLKGVKSSHKNSNRTGKVDANQEIEEMKCPKCYESTSKENLRKNLYVCPCCGYHYSISAKFRIANLVDEGAFKETGEKICGKNPLEFPGYEEKLAKAVADTGLKEAVITGVGKIEGEKAVICVMDSRFMMASMGAAVGEKIAAAFEYATKKKLPVIVFTASGGARMQEGIVSLFQMAKTSAAVGRHSDGGNLFISVMTNPTTGGVTASFASLGDIILAEPDALIGFAGPRVIQQTIGQKLPEGFQRAEYVRECGFVDRIVKRIDLRQELATLLKLHRRK